MRKTVGAWAALSVSRPASPSSFAVLGVVCMRADPVGYERPPASESWQTDSYSLLYRYKYSSQFSVMFLSTLPIDDAVGTDEQGRRPGPRATTANGVRPTPARQECRAHERPTPARQEGCVEKDPIAVGVDAVQSTGPHGCPEMPCTGPRHIPQSGMTPRADDWRFSTQPECRAHQRPNTSPARVPGLPTANDNTLRPDRAPIGSPAQAACLAPLSFLRTPRIIHLRTYWQSETFRIQ